jgi:hypothetical protein
MLLKQSKESEKEVEQITVVKQEEVEKGMADKIRIMRELITEQDGMVFHKYMGGRGNKTVQLLNF